MKIINRKAEREKEIIENENNSANAILRKENDKRKKEELEKEACTIKIVCDWRISEQLNPIIEGMWPHETQLNIENFLNDAIGNRSQLKELYVEPFEYNAYGNTKVIEKEYDKDTIELLSSEASKEGLKFNEYVTSIVYTTALNINKEREKVKIIADADAVERTPFMISEGFISQELKRKLESKYGKPTGIMVTNDVYTNMLIDVAKEYFKIKK